MRCLYSFDNIDLSHIGQYLCPFSEWLWLKFKRWAMLVRFPQLVDFLIAVPSTRINIARNKMAIKLVQNRCPWIQPAGKRRKFVKRRDHVNRPDLLIMLVLVRYNDFEFFDIMIAINQHTGYIPLSIFRVSLPKGNIVCGLPLDKRMRHFSVPEKS